MVLTRFACPSLYALLLVKLLHYRVRPQIRRVAPATSAARRSSSGGPGRC